jgi:hypothetical protein
MRAPWWCGVALVAVLAPAAACDGPSREVRIQSLCDKICECLGAALPAQHEACVPQCAAQVGQAFVDNEACVACIEERGCGEIIADACDDVCATPVTGLELEGLR